MRKKHLDIDKIKSQALYLQESLQKELIAKRKSLGINQTELAKRSGLSQSTVCHIEKHNVKLNLQTLFQYMIALDLDFQLYERGEK